VNSDFPGSASCAFKDGSNAKTDDIADGLRPANMQMIGFTVLIHLDADGGSLTDATSEAARAQAKRRSHEPDSFSFERS
jgi:hypothetical protein